MRKPPRVLIEEWLPAAAIGVECMREEMNPIAKPPTKYFHVWWARRPLVVSRAAVLGSLLPADYDRDDFERLLGFGLPGDVLVALRRRMDSGERIEGGFGCRRAFSNPMPEASLARATTAIQRLWGRDVAVLDPMAGGGSIPYEAARLGLRAIANEYNPVACSILEASVDYPFRFGKRLETKVSEWAKVWVARCEARLAEFYPKDRRGLVHAYIYARTVPCRDTPGHPSTPLVPDWHLLRSRTGGRAVMAEPFVEEGRREWRVRIRDPWRAKNPPLPTYKKGRGTSLFLRQGVIPADYIQAKAQSREMGARLYAVAVKGTRLEFRPPSDADIEALEKAERELTRLTKKWHRDNIIPTEKVPSGDKTGNSGGQGTDVPLKRGEDTWCDMFTPRQLLAMGVLVEELNATRAQVVAADGKELGEAVVHILSLALDKFADWNCTGATWQASKGAMAHKFDRHDYSFKATFAELAPCAAGTGLSWAIGNTLKAYRELSGLPRSERTQAVSVSLGTATNLPNVADKTVTAVVVDPPYDDNVQYAELADFFYVWLKRTQGHRRPEWFSSYLCDKTEEAVVNIERHRQASDSSTADTKRRAREFYQGLMVETFREARRVLRDDGVLCVMFTHKKQEAWAALFQSLVGDIGKRIVERGSGAGFQITATWPVKTESEHSLNLAKKNSAQSTVLLVCRKRSDSAGTAYWESDITPGQVREAALCRARQLADGGFNPVDQLVGSFGPAIAVLSQHGEVRQQTGELVDLGGVLDTAAKAVMEWRLARLVPVGLRDLDPDSQFVLLCWDVQQAAEFRFDQARLMSTAVNRDLLKLEDAGLVIKRNEWTRMAPAQSRRRERKLEQREIDDSELDLGAPKKRRVKKGQVRKIHPQDPEFRTSIDACHALAMAAVKRDGSVDVGAAKDLARSHSWLGKKECAVARLMKALVKAAPVGLRNPDKKGSAAKDYPEFRAWHDLLKPLFGIEPPDWTEKPETQMGFFVREGEPDEEPADEVDEKEEGGEE